MDTEEMKLYNLKDITIQTFDDSEVRKATGASLKTLAKIFPYSANGSKERIQELQNKGAGIYMTTNPQDDGFSRGVEYTKRFQYLSLDLDIAKEKTHPTKEDLEVAKLKLFDELKTLPLPPYGVMFTKNGLQPVWKFADPLELERKEERNKANAEFQVMVRAVTQVLGHKSEGDSICRVIRLPGSLHLKTPADSYKIIYQEISGQECKFEEFNKAYPDIAYDSASTSKGVFDWTKITGTAEGEGRNDKLLRATRSSYARGIPEDSILDMMVGLNQTFKPPLSDDEFKEVFEQAKKYSDKEAFDIDSKENKTSWPSPINEAALHGIAGEFIRLVEPHSEADPVYLLTGFLTAFGSLIGDKSYIQVERTKHKMKLFTVHVGSTSKGRKGTAWDQVRPIFDYVDPSWSKNIVNGGLATGEGLINAVKDPVTKVKDGQEVTLEDGVIDKRLLVIEPEFASVLKVMNREHNILSPILRSAWDRGDLRTLTKTAPLRATGSHISIIGHIVKEELLKCLSSTEMANGFGNRILFFMGKRSKKLAFGGKLPYVELENISKELAVIFDKVKNVEELTFDEQTRELWIKIYSDLTEDDYGLVGSMSARVEPYTLRLAGIYALLDFSEQIRTEHLRAAIAVIDYYYESLVYLFGNTISDPLAEKIIKALSDRRMSKDDLSNHFGRHRNSSDLTDSLNLLKLKGLILEEEQRTAGRSKTIYYLNSLNSLNSQGKEYIKKLDKYISELPLKNPISTTDERAGSEESEISEGAPLDDAQKGDSDEPPY